MRWEEEVFLPENPGEKMTPANPAENKGDTQQQPLLWDLV